jgi:hypothetical protein
MISVSAHQIAIICLTLTSLLSRIKLLPNDGFISDPGPHRLPKELFGAFGGILRTTVLRRSELAVLGCLQRGRFLGFAPGLRFLGRFGDCTGHRETVSKSVTW